MLGPTPTFFLLLPLLPKGSGRGGGTPIYELYGYVSCEWYGFQAVKSGIGYRNQTVLA